MKGTFPYFIALQLLFTLSCNLLFAQNNIDKKQNVSKPCPIVTIAGTFVDGSIMNKDLLMASALIPIQKGLGPDIFYTVKSFKALTTHASGVSKDFLVSGNHLTAELKSEINSLASGDKIKFYNLETKEPGTNSAKIFCIALPITITIK